MRAENKIKTHDESATLYITKSNAASSSDRNANFKTNFTASFDFPLVAPMSGKAKITHFLKDLLNRFTSPIPLLSSEWILKKNFDAKMLINRN